MKDVQQESQAVAQDAKKVFRKMGTCSRTFFYLLNREFGNTMETAERAADPLAGGILKKGYQCGMLWGASLAAGAEAYRTCTHQSQAIAVAIEATRFLIESFEAREKTTQCREITHCDFESNLSFLKYMLSGRFLHCFQMAEDWAPEAVEQAKSALKDRPHDFKLAESCSSVLAEKMGASKEEVVMVAGFAGGLGLSSSGCGALSAAIWMHALAWCREHKTGTAVNDPRGKEIMEAFVAFTGGKMRCIEICQHRFTSPEEHTKYLNQGGCSQLIDHLAHA